MSVQQFLILSVHRVLAVGAVHLKKKKKRRNKTEAGDLTSNLKCYVASKYYTCIYVLVWWPPMASFHNEPSLHLSGIRWSIIPLRCGMKDRGNKKAGRKQTHTHIYVCVCVCVCVCDIRYREKRCSGLWRPFTGTDKCRWSQCHLWLGLTTVGVGG